MSKEQIKEDASFFDIVFNTVPVLILNKDVLKKFKRSCLIIDLASNPGGTDFDYAKKLNLKTIWALGLPGKYSPRTSGEITADIILKISDGKD